MSTPLMKDAVQVSAGLRPVCDDFAYSCLAMWQVKRNPGKGTAFDTLLPPKYRGDTGAGRRHKKPKYFDTDV